MKLIFLDTETTGNEPKKDRLCQVCYKVGDNIRTEFFKPPMPIPVKAMSIHHVTNKMVADKPAFENSQMRKDLEVMLADGHIVVAHNADFDCAILANEGVNIPRKICTLRVARHLDSEGVIPEYNLQFLRYYLGLEIEATPHDAEGDVTVLHAVFGRLLAKMMEKFPSEDEAIEEMIKISGRPSLLKKMSFGKYKGKSFQEVRAIDRGYLEWLLKQKLESPGEDEDLVYTLKEYLK